MGARSLATDEANEPGGGIPLITVGGYALVGDGYDLSLLQGKSFNAVQHAMQRGNRSDPLVSAINGEANSITAFICHADQLQTQVVAAALSLALLFGLVVPLLVYATRLALADASQAGGTALGAIFGTVSMTCCAPVILPAILSLLGFSGTTILHVNQTLNRFWMPLAVAGIILWPVGVSGFDSGRHVVGRVDLEPLVREATRQQHEFIVVVHQEDADPSGSTPLAFIASRGDER